MKIRYIAFLMMCVNVLLAQTDVELSLDTEAAGTFLVEACASDLDSLTIGLEPRDSAVQYIVAFGGTALEGIDYRHELPDTIQIDSGSTSVKYLIAPIADGEVEQTDTIEIRLLDLDGGEVSALTVLLLDELTVTITPDEVEVCQADTVTLSTEIAGLYHWIVGGDTIRGSSVSFAAHEPSEVQVYTSLGACQATDEIDIELLAGISFDAGDTTFVCFDDQAFVSVDIIGDPAGTYEWSPMDSTLEVLSNQSIRVTTDVTRTYYLTFENSSCRITDSVVVRVDSLPELPITVIVEKDEYCPGETVTLFSRYLSPTDFPDVEFEWMYDAGTSLNGDSSLNFTLVTEDTAVYRRMTTNNACMRTDSVTLYVINPPVNLSLTDTVVCPNNPVQVELLNAEDFDKIEWMPEQGLSCTECADPVIRTPQSMTFTVSLESMGCPTSGSVNINIFPPEPMTVVPDTAVCPGEPVGLSVVEADQYDDITWQGPGLTCTSCDSPTASPVESSFYQVAGTKPDGCLGAGSGGIITFSLPRVGGIAASPAGAVEQGTIVTLTATTIPDITNTGTFRWYADGVELEGATSAVVMTPVNSEGANVFKVEIESPEGCMGMGEITIEGKPPKYEIPSAFTPTGDDINDRFKVLIFGNVRLADFKIFNRYGQMVYDSVAEEGWDGRHKGKDAPSDIYAYTAVLERADGSIETVRGEVALLR